MDRKGRPLSEVELLLTHNITHNNEYLGLVSVERIDGVTGTFEVFEEGGRNWYTDFQADDEEES